MTRAELLQGLQAATKATLAKLDAPQALPLDRHIVVDGRAVLAELCSGCEGFGTIPEGGGITGLGPDATERLCGVCRGRQLVPVTCEECGQVYAVARDRYGNALCAGCVVALEGA